MPPKLKSKNKSNKTKKSVNLGICEVKNCNKPAVCAWSTPDMYGYQSEPHFICNDCMKLHCTKSNPFILHDEFGYEKFEMDKSGHPAVKDEQECLNYLAKFNKKSNSNSINRLREWKKKNPNKKRLKKFSPRQISAYRKNKNNSNINKKVTKKTKRPAPTKIPKSDIDSIFDDIMK